MNVRHLRVLPPAEPEPPGRVFVVVRSEHVEPGTPRVIAEVLDLGVGVASPYTGAEVLRRDEMAEDPALTDALRAWEAGDDTLFAEESAAYERFLERAERGSSGRRSRISDALAAADEARLRSMAAHPSSIASARERKPSVPV